MKTILILNGPNLNMLGVRELGVYGATSLSDIQEMLEGEVQGKEVTLEFFQSNTEGALIDQLHSTLNRVAGVVFNPGAYTHTSVALRDAILSIAPTPVVEVHLTNVYARPDTFRHKSVLAPVCVGQISGFGAKSYVLGLQAVLGLDATR